MVSRQVRERFFDAESTAFDVVLTTHPEHIHYLTGYRSMAHDAFRNYKTAALVGPHEVMLVAATADAAPALEVLGDPDRLWRYGEFYVGHAGDAPAFGRAPFADFGAALQDALSVLGAGRTPRIGLDHTGGFLVAEDVRAALDGWPVADATAALLRQRQRKTPGEVERIRRAVAAIERGMVRAFEAAAPGVTEGELAGLIAGEIHRGGGIPRLTVVASGPRSALVDTYVSQRVLARGDLLRLDVACTVDGYWADMARTAVLGEPTALQAQRYAAIAAGQQAEVQALRPGVSAGELFELALRTTHEAGLPGFMRNHCGHGVGVECNEGPRIVKDSKAVLEAGMVLSLETPFYERGWGGMMVEDVVEVTEGGFERLSTLPRALAVL